MRFLRGLFKVRRGPMLRTADPNEVFYDNLASSKFVTLWAG